MRLWFPLKSALLKALSASSIILLVLPLSHDVHPFWDESYLLELLEDAALSAEPRTPEKLIREGKINRLTKRDFARYCCRRRSSQAEERTSSWLCQIFAPSDSVFICLYTTLSRSTDANVCELHVENREVRLSFHCLLIVPWWLSPELEQRAPAGRSARDTWAMG